MYVADPIGLLRNTKKGDTSADSFIPLLIFVVLRANPDHLVSNIQYILRFRNQEKLGGEAGYYLSSLVGRFHSFIERKLISIVWSYSIYRNTRPNKSNGE